MASRYIREFLALEAFKNAGRDVSDILPRLVKFLCCLQVTKTHLFTVTLVPKGHVWIEGDNIYESNDSRKFGPVPYGLLQGRVSWRIWPPKDFGSLVQNKGKDSIS